MANGAINLLSNKPQGIKAVTFSRHGGVSHPPFDSLNVSYDVGDDEISVTQNITAIKLALNAKILMHCVQVHGHNIGEVSATTDNDVVFSATDALITDQIGVAIMIKHADCQAITLYDPDRRVVANLHCGWRGLVQKLPQKALQTMQERYGCSPKSILAAISPSLGPCCAEFKGWESLFPEDFKRYRLKSNHFDLWQVAKAAIESAGVLEEHIEMPTKCTVCSTDYFSYRREKITGRCATVVMLT